VIPNSKVKTLDIITSALNEEECLIEFIRRIKQVMGAHSDYSWRLIICDNGSRDQTWEIISSQSMSDERILGIRMSRTFPLDAAFTMGLDQANADAAVIMASDLQDPPEVIHQFIEKFEEGYEQVVVKINRRSQVPFIRRLLTQFFYYIANKSTKNLIPRGVSDFRLLNRPAYEAARQIRERNRFLRGLLAWMGFRTFQVEIERPDRFAGESEFTKIRLRVVLRWAIGAILAHTTTPLHIVSMVGFLLSGLSILVTSVFSVLWFTKGVPFAGFGSIVGLLSLGFSVILAAIGVIAQYLALIYEEVKLRPIYIVAESTKPLK
jgi:glycosyltransferase involved in cell wall biosynthesis